MKYFFLLSEKFYRVIEWEWNTLKNLRRTKRKNFFLRGSFALFSLFSILFFIFSPPFAFGLLFGEGFKFSTLDPHQCPWRADRLAIDRSQAGRYRWSGPMTIPYCALTCARATSHDDER